MKKKQIRAVVTDMTENRHRLTVEPQSPAEDYANKFRGAMEGLAQPGKLKKVRVNKTKAEMYFDLQRN